MFDAVLHRIPGYGVKELFREVPRFSRYRCSVRSACSAGTAAKGRGHARAGGRQFLVLLVLLCQQGPMEAHVARDTRGKRSHVYTVPTRGHICDFSYCHDLATGQPTLGVYWSCVLPENIEESGAGGGGGG